ncbi:hypothetical protein CRG98_009900 [Punica granatum]|uniref:Uncharacterized protein n=1 Tax=Punica granatum TaxID=22663 RepID=A0A2I0KMP2_PUNGR|nr:hypothetical protein CRG98_009900 [Punica granatum]
MTEDELWAVAYLRIRSFYEFDPATFRVQVRPASPVTFLVYGQLLAVVVAFTIRLPLSAPVSLQGIRWRSEAGP